MSTLCCVFRRKYSFFFEFVKICNYYQNSFYMPVIPGYLENNRDIINKNQNWTFSSQFIAVAQFKTLSNTKKFSMNINKRHIHTDKDKKEKI